MGITTFTGPVRANGGFQEWDGTEWVPIAGGGVENQTIPPSGVYDINVPILELGQSITYVKLYNSTGIADQYTMYFEDTANREIRVYSEFVNANTSPFSTSAALTINSYTFSPTQRTFTVTVTNMGGPSSAYDYYVYVEYSVSTFG